jgi:hypothetical protein
MVQFFILLQRYKKRMRPESPIPKTLIKDMNYLQGIIKEFGKTPL